MLEYDRRNYEKEANENAPKIIAQRASQTNEQRPSVA